MKNSIKTGVVTIAFAAGAMFLSGCATGNYAVIPSDQPYAFIKNTPEYTNYFDQVYSPANRQRKASSESDNMVNVLVSSPTNLKMEFYKNRYLLDPADQEVNTVRFRSGVYPFELKQGKDTWRTGAMMFYNIDKTLGLAKLGLGNKVILDPRLVDQAGKGRLGKYTMKFDDKEVLTYWVGNRKQLFVGGTISTVEVDFSWIPGISELLINGKPVEGFSRQLDVTSLVKDAQGRFQLVPVEYKIEFTVQGKTYRGYLQKLKDNEYTAFVKIPCTIPPELLLAADQGTVSRFSVVCGEGDSKEAVAEIVISRK